MLSTALFLTATLGRPLEPASAPAHEVSDSEYHKLLKLTHHHLGAALGRKGFELKDWKNAVIKAFPLPNKAPKRLEKDCDPAVRAKMSEEEAHLIGDCFRGESELVVRHGLGSTSPTWSAKTCRLACEPKPVAKVELSCHRTCASEDTMVCHEAHDATVYEALTTDGKIINLHCHEWLEGTEKRQRCHAAAEGDRVFTKPLAKKHVAVE